MSSSESSVPQTPAADHHQHQNSGILLPLHAQPTLLFVRRPVAGWGNPQREELRSIWERVGRDLGLGDGFLIHLVSENLAAALSFVLDSPEGALGKSRPSDIVTLDIGGSTGNLGRSKHMPSADEPRSLRPGTVQTPVSRRRA